MDETLKRSEIKIEGLEKQLKDKYKVKQENN